MKLSSKHDLHIILLEDKEADAQLVGEALRRGGLACDLRRVETREAFLNELNTHTPDLILSDHGLPAFDGWSALQLAKDVKPEVPFIFVTGTIRDGNEDQRLKKGATDYVLKKHLFSSLVPAVQRALKEKQETERRHQAENQLALVMSQMAEALIVVDHESRYTCVNARAEVMLGVTQESLIGKVMWDDFPKHIGPHFHENYYRAIASQTPVQAEEYFYTSHRWYDYRIYPSPEGATILFQNITDRRLAEEGLRHNEARKRLMMDLSLDAIISIDHLGVVQEWNPAAERIFQFSRTEALGEELAQLIVPPYLRVLHRQGLAFFLETGEGPFLGQRVELTAVRKDGHEFPVELTVNRIPMEGLPVYTAIVRDITTRKKAEDALKESEERFRTMADTAPVMIWLADIDGKCWYFNKPWLDFTGRTLEEESGNGWLTHVHPADRDRCMDRYLSAFKLEKNFKTEYRLKRADGEYRWVLDTGVPRLSPGGSLVGYIGSAIDITDRKQAESALRKSEERFRMLVENVQDYAIYMLDPKGRVASWNTGAERIEGYKAEEIIGKHFSRFFLREDIKKGKPARELHLAQEEGRFQEEGWRVRRNGSRYWASILLTPLKDETGRLYGFSKIARDITERKAAQEVICRLNADLEQRVANRTAQMEAANKELEAFSYSVSHDLRAPLRHIDGFVSILQNNLGETIDERSQNYLKIISESAKEMGELIDDLLEFSRMGRAELRKTRVNFSQLAQDVAQNLHSKQPEREVEWIIKELPTCAADPAMIRQALINLISNALKYTRDRAVARIEIGYEETPKECIFHVKDNGVGFDMQFVNKLFGVFQRLHSTKDFEGTGIGLANVRRIVQRHGGRTWAEGVLGEGATFFFSLPLQPEPDFIDIGL